MILPDVNVLIYAFKQGNPEYPRFRGWLDRVVNSAEPFALSELVLSGFLRVITSPAIFQPPTPLAEALAFAEAARHLPNCVIVRPGPHHWDIFIDLCKTVGVQGNQVSDAHHAALAIESGCEWISMDGGFARFPGLRWRRPL